MDFSESNNEGDTLLTTTTTPNEASDFPSTHRRTNSDTNRKKRLCRYPGCTRVIKSQGHCQRHGAKAKRCKVRVIVCWFRNRLLPSHPSGPNCFCNCFVLCCCSRSRDAKSRHRGPTTACASATGEPCIFPIRWRPRPNAKRNSRNNSLPHPREKASTTRFCRHRLPIVRPLLRRTKSRTPTIRRHLPREHRPLWRPCRWSTFCGTVPSTSPLDGTGRPSAGREEFCSVPISEPSWSPGKNSWHSSRSCC